MQKPPLLYDYSNQKVIKKRKLRHRLFLLGINGLIIFGCSLIIDGALKGEIRMDGKWWEIYFIGIAMFFMMFITIFTLKCIAIKDLKVYENGIISPFRSFSQILKRQENFIPFSQTESVYSNKRQNLEYVTIVLKGNDSYPINKKWIYDLDKFINILRGRVKVIEDIDYIVVRR